MTVSRQHAAERLVADAIILERACRVLARRFSKDDLLREDLMEYARKLRGDAGEAEARIISNGTPGARRDAVPVLAHLGIYPHLRLTSYQLARVLGWGTEGTTRAGAALGVLLADNLVTRDESHAPDGQRRILWQRAEPAEPADDGQGEA